MDLKGNFFDAVGWLNQELVGEVDAATLVKLNQKVSLAVEDRFDSFQFLAETVLENEKQNQNVLRGLNDELNVLEDENEVLDLNVSDSLNSDARKILGSLLKAKEELTKTIGVLSEIGSWETLLAHFHVFERQRGLVVTSLSSELILQYFISLQTSLTVLKNMSNHSQRKNQLDQVQQNLTRYMRSRITNQLWSLNQFDIKIIDTLQIVPFLISQFIKNAIHKFQPESTLAQHFTAINNLFTTNEPIKRQVAAKLAEELCNLSFSNVALSPENLERLTANVSSCEEIVSEFSQEYGVDFKASMKDAISRFLGEYFDLEKRGFETEFKKLKINRWNQSNIKKCSDLYSFLSVSAISRCNRLNLDTKVVETSLNRVFKDNTSLIVIEEKISLEELSKMQVYPASFDFDLSQKIEKSISNVLFNPIEIELNRLKVDSKVSKSMELINAYVWTLPEKLQPFTCDFTTSFRVDMVLHTDEFNMLYNTSNNESVIRKCIEQRKNLMFTSNDEKQSQTDFMQFWLCKMLFMLADKIPVNNISDLKSAQNLFNSIFDTTDEIISSKIQSISDQVSLSSILQSF